MIDKNIFKEIIPFKGQLSFIIISDIFQVIMIVLSAYIIAYLADELLFYNLSYDTATPLLVLLFFFFIIKAILNYYNHLKMKKISLNVQSKLRFYLLEALIYNFELQEKQTKGKWLAIITKGVDKLDIYLTNFLPQLGILLTYPIILLVFAVINDWISGMIFLFTAPLIPFFMILIGKLADKENKKQWQIFQKLTSYMADLLSGLLVIKAYNQTQNQLLQVDKNGKDFSETTLKVLKIAFISAFMLEFIATLSIAIIAVNIGLRLLYGQVDFLPVFFILLIAPQFYQPFRQFGTAFHDAMNGITASSEIYRLVNKVLQKNNEIVRKSDFYLKSAPSIKFEMVDYMYRQDIKVLEKLNFIVNAGEQIVLTGKNGAGKSTIFKLLLKIDKPFKGKIFIDEQDLKDIDTVNWRKQIGWVAQEPYIFSTTVKENILMGKNCSENELRKIIDVVNLNDFINDLPNGYDTVLDKKTRVSSGQKRRLGIARALVNNPKVLLLDEPMENLDVHNEEMLQKTLQFLKGKVTTIIIAHRKQTIQNADKIILLDNGKMMTLDISKKQIKEQIYVK